MIARGTRGRRRAPRGRHVVAALISVVVVGCSIQPDTAPRVIPPNDRVELNPLLAEGGEATGTTRLYLVAAGDGGERELRAVARDVDATPTAALQELLKGPNPQEVDSGLSTELPRGMSLLSARQGGRVLQVDVSEEILDLPAPGTVLAVAQLVFTASQIEGVEQVRLRVNGESRAWPDGRGELTTAPLTTYDYPGLVESTQPAYPPIPSGQRAG